MKKIILTGLVLAASLATAAHAAGDAAAGKAKAAACGGCHGLDGNSPAPTFPKLAGQGEKYIVKQVDDFKANITRKNEIMFGMVAALNEQDAADIGAFYSEQTLASAAPADESKLALGEEIYKGGNLTSGLPACQSCHGPRGAGMEGAGYPQLGGQYVEYTLLQLHAFKNGTRTNDDKQLMRSIVAQMSDAEIEAVANYIASLK